MDNTFQNLHQLSSLTLDSYDDIRGDEYTPDSPEDILQLSAALSKLTQIKELYLNYIKYYINDETLNSVSRACPYIHTLELGCSDNITDTGLLYLCRLEHLTNLNLEECRNITDEGVKLLAQQRRLHNLELGLCTQLTDDSVIQLAQCCLNLTYLSLFNCSKITNASVWAFYNTADKKTIPLQLDIFNTNVTVRKRDVRHLMLKIINSEKVFLTDDFNFGD